MALRAVHYGARVQSQGMLTQFMSNFCELGLYSGGIATSAALCRGGIRTQYHAALSQRKQGSLTSALEIANVTFMAEPCMYIGTRKIKYAQCAMRL